MYVCVKCRREMFCDRNEVPAIYETSHVYPADRFKCPECGLEILATNTNPIHEPSPGMRYKEFVQMKENQ